MRFDDAAVGFAVVEGGADEEVGSDVIKRVALLALAAIALAGCGGDDNGGAAEPMTRAEYQTALSTIVNEGAGPAVALYTGLVARPRPQHKCAMLMNRFDERVNQVIDDVSTLVPPGDVASIQESFLAAANVSLAKVSEIADKVDAGDFACGDDLKDAVYGMPSSDQAEEAIAELESHGYVVFGK